MTVQPPTRTGLLLVNTGTPKSPQTADVRRYLRQFLSDPRVIDMPALGRWLLLNLIILPFRPRKSAHAYRQIWTPRGSPLLFHGQDLAAGLQAALGTGVEVRLAMQFGEPSIAGALDAFQAAGIDRVVALPLFPQYASASFGSAAAAVLNEAGRRWTVPSVQIIPPFFQEAEYLDVVAALLQRAIAREQPDHVVLSYHGVPERHCTRTDLTGAHCLKSEGCCNTLESANRSCYRAQCMATSRALIERLHLDPTATTTCFQSRLGKIPWIRPYFDDVIAELGRKGVKNVVVAEPSFVADCLETIEEIGLRGRETFQQAGGGDLVLVPAPNATPEWVAAVAKLVRRSSTWID
ncbi:MAG: ferrochelatase [Myxococcota bacterium]